MGEEDIGAPCDIYAMGCVVYETLSGELPFTGPSPQAIIARQISERPWSIRTVRPDVPESMEAAVLASWRSRRRPARKLRALWWAEWPLWNDEHFEPRSLNSMPPPALPVVDWQGALPLATPGYLQGFGGGAGGSADSTISGFIWHLTMEVPRQQVEVVVTWELA